MAEKKKVAVYSTSTCPYCKQAKTFLEDNGVAYEEFDVGADGEKRKEMIDKSGQMGVPVIDIEGKVIVGFDREAIKEALGI